MTFWASNPNIMKDNAKESVRIRKEQGKQSDECVTAFANGISFGEASWENPLCQKCHRFKKCWETAPCDKDGKPHIWSYYGMGGRTCYKCHIDIN